MNLVRLVTATVFIAAVSVCVLTLCPIRSLALGLGMTMPTSAPAEAQDLNLGFRPAAPFTVPDPPTTLLPAAGYEAAPRGFLDGSALSFVTGTCTPNATTCPASGMIREQDGRLNQFLRGSASSQDAKYILLNAVWTALGLGVPGNPSISSCGSNPATCASALAQLAVTGRQAYNSFIAWNPQYAPEASGPQESDLLKLGQSGYHTNANQLLSSNVSAIPPIPHNITASRIQLAANTVIQQAYTALWAIRSNDPTWRQFRAGAGWIAVSGEDDTPHRPVNVPTAPFPQFDIAVPITVVPPGGAVQSYTITTRYMLASQDSLIKISLLPPLCPSCPRLPKISAAPPIPTVPHLVQCSQPQPPLPHRACPVQRLLAIPTDSPKTVTGDSSWKYIIYIHGGGSRLEEADALAEQLVAQSSGPVGSFHLMVISFDLPNSAYADQWLRVPQTNPVYSGGPPKWRHPIVLDPSLLFEDNPTGNIYNYPLLGFTMMYISNFIAALGQQGIIDRKDVLAVVGGSLGGNLSLLMKMNYQQPYSPSWQPGGTSSTMAPNPYNPANQIGSVNKSLLPPSASVVAWSPTSMVSYADSAGLIVGNSLSIGNNYAAWGPEVVEQRGGFLAADMCQPTSPAAGPYVCDTDPAIFIMFITKIPPDFQPI